MSDAKTTNPALRPDQQFLSDLWDEQVRDEFVIRDTAATLDTMVPAIHPADAPGTAITPVSRTIGADRLGSCPERQTLAPVSAGTLS